MFGDIFKIIIGGIIFIAVFAIIGHLFGFLEEKVFNKADKEAKKGNGKWLGAILIIVIAGWIIISVLQCSSCSKQDFDSNNWEPRHTQIEKPTQNNVNTISILFAPIAG